MRSGNNLKLRGGGLHHIAIEASDFERSLRFYTEGLGFRNVLTFSEESQTVAMLDTGDGTYVELFSGGTGEKPNGSLLHFAVRTDDCEAATEQAMAAGGSITQEPTDLCSRATRRCRCATRFARGPTESRSSCCRPTCSDPCKSRRRN